MFPVQFSAKISKGRRGNFFLLWNVYGAARKPLTQCIEHSCSLSPRAGEHKGWSVKFSFSYSYSCSCSCHCSLFISLSICFRQFAGNSFRFVAAWNLIANMKTSGTDGKGDGGGGPGRGRQRASDGDSGALCTVSTWNFRLGCCLFI